MGCDANVKTVTLSSAYLYGGSTATAATPANSSFLLQFNNPESSTYITSLSLSSYGSPSATGDPLANTTDIALGPTTLSLQASTASSSSTRMNTTSAEVNVTTWQTGRNSSELIDFSRNSPANTLNSGQVSSFTFYPRTSVPKSIIPGSTFNYAVTFSNGESVSGSLIAQ